MNNYKYISTTLPYINSTPHIGHCFEFVLADVIAEFNRLHHKKVFFNVGIDEHGAKVYQKALDENYSSTILYCDALSDKWKEFCASFKINYDNFYRTTSDKHKENVIRFYNEIIQHIYTKEYTGQYCVGCEAFVTKAESTDNHCNIHKTELTESKEVNKFFDLSKFKAAIVDILVDKSRSNELRNIIDSDFDLSITRQNVEWGIKIEDDVFYVWFEALLNYIFAIGFYDNRELFDKYWSNSLIICGKYNLKFQAYILQSLLLSNNVPQTKEVLVHGTILDNNGTKMTKTLGNVINPIEQLELYGLDAVRYYLTFGLNTTSDSKYSEEELVSKWNNEVVNGLGNLISRLLHLIELKDVTVDEHKLNISSKTIIINNSYKLNNLFESYNLKEVGSELYNIVSNLNKRITEEKPFDKNCINYEEILNEIYFELKSIIPYYSIILKEHSESLNTAFKTNKKTIIFNRLETSLKPC